MRREEDRGARAYPQKGLQRYWCIAKILSVPFSGNDNFLAGLGYNLFGA